MVMWGQGEDDTKGRVSLITTLIDDYFQYIVVLKYIII